MLLGCLLLSRPDRWTPSTSSRTALDTDLASLSNQYEEALANARCEIAAEADQAPRHG